jgi:hypothetical protein
MAKTVEIGNAPFQWADKAKRGMCKVPNHWLAQFSLPPADIQLIRRLMQMADTNVFLSADPPAMPSLLKQTNIRLTLAPRLTYTQSHRVNCARNSHLDKS